MYTHTRVQSTHGVHSDARSWQDLPPEHTTVYLTHTCTPQQPLHTHAHHSTLTHTCTPQQPLHTHIHHSWEQTCNCLTDGTPSDSRALPISPHEELHKHSPTPTNLTQVSPTPTNLTQVSPHTHTHYQSH